MMMNKQPVSHSRVPPLMLAILALLIVLIFTPPLVTMIRSNPDYRAHIRWAIELRQTGHFDQPIPQFLFHVLVIGISDVLPGDTLLARIQTAAWAVGILGDLYIGLTIFYLLTPAFSQLSTRLRWPMAIALTLTLMLVSAINIFTWGNHHLYLGYLTAITYHNPTVTLLKPFALATFLVALRIFSDARPSWKIVLLGVALSALNTLAKPNFALSLIPALLLVTTFVYMKKWTVNWRLLAAILLPMVGILLWQIFYYKTSDTNGFEFAPLKTMNLLSPSGGLLPKFLLSIPFPLAVYLLYYREAYRRLDLNLAWITFGSAAAYTYLLAEIQHAGSGNFTWGAQVTLFILFVASALFLVQQNIGLLTAKPPRWKFAACLFLLSLHLVGGIALYIAHLSPNANAWW